MFSKIDTPAVLIDIDIVKSNISKFQSHCDKQDLKLRPHIKTHKISKFAKWQIEAGVVAGNASLTISHFSEEHGCMISDRKTLVSIGDKVRIIPNHAYVVSKMVDHILLVQVEQLIGVEQVVARGHVC